MSSTCSFACSDWPCWSTAGLSNQSHLFCYTNDRYTWRPFPSLLRLIFSILWPLEPLADGPRNTAGGTPELAVTLGVAPACAKAKADSGGPGAALEQQHGKDDAEAGAERRLDDQVRQAPVPLSPPNPSSFLSASILCNGVARDGERTEGGGGGVPSR